MLELSKVSVEVAGKVIVRDVSFRIGRGELFALMGPNGSGKTTLAYAIMGHPGYRVVEGRVVFENTDITKTPPYERARMGIFLFFQNPVEVRGVSLRDLARHLSRLAGGGVGNIDSVLEEEAKNIGLRRELLDRGLNEGFSGGEKKRSELLQSILLKPKCLILDEPDSGMDVEGVRLLTDYIRKSLDEGKCILLVTHYPALLNEIEPTRVLVLNKGRIVAEGGVELAEKIAREGYSWLV
ncbi:Fe-S cluster assembly ATPase SufC [Thermogladius sp. 4427co]|uniref:Fe-S cluster assembly ATPase SufC n=1 Tax=Thermogladius sp. 4427co TaxID=3450718 RepID=UPI003F78E9DD